MLDQHIMAREDCSIATIASRGDFDSDLPVKACMQELCLGWCSGVFL